jgi:hypothetical protein
MGSIGYYCSDECTPILESLLDELTWEGIAYWYMDDGGLQGKYGSTVQLHTEGFKKEESQLLAAWLTNLGTPAKLGKSGKYWVVTLSKEAAIKFIENVRPYVIPSLLYKCEMTLEHCQCGAVLKNSSMAQCPTCRPAAKAACRAAWFKQHHEANKDNPEYIQRRQEDSRRSKKAIKEDPERYSLAQQQWKAAGERRRAKPGHKEDKNLKARELRAKKAAAKAALQPPKPAQEERRELINRKARELRAAKLASGLPDSPKDIANKEKQRIRSLRHVEKKLALKLSQLSTLVKSPSTT